MAGVSCYNSTMPEVAPELDVPLTDDSGDVDISLLQTCLELSLPERMERHYHARRLVEQLQAMARERYGSLLDDLAASE